MKWQLARLTHEAAKGDPRDVGIEVWVLAKPPSISPTHGWLGYETNLQGIVDRVFIRADRVELLPTFSDDIEIEPWAPWIEKRREANQ